MIFFPLISQFFLQGGQLRARDVTISDALRHISSLIAPTDLSFTCRVQKSLGLKELYQKNQNPV